MNGTELKAALREQGVTNGRKLADRLDCPVIFFVVSERNRYMRAELHYAQYGDRKVLVRTPDTGLEGLSSKRANAVEKAKLAAEGITRYGRDGWSRAPFSNCWIPTEKLSELHEQFEK